MYNESYELNLPEVCVNIIIKVRGILNYFTNPFQENSHGFHTTAINGTLTLY
jgi:hypothetical protein